MERAGETRCRLGSYVYGSSEVKLLWAENGEDGSGKDVTVEEVPEGAETNWCR